MYQETVVLGLKRRRCGLSRLQTGDHDPVVHHELWGGVKMCRPGAKISARTARCRHRALSDRWWPTLNATSRTDMQLGLLVSRGGLPCRMVVYREAP